MKTLMDVVFEHAKEIPNGPSIHWLRTLVTRLEAGGIEPPGVLRWWEAQRARYLVPILESGGWRLFEYEGTGPFRPIGPFAKTLGGAIQGAAKEAGWEDWVEGREP